MKTKNILGIATMAGIVIVMFLLLMGNQIGSIPLTKMEESGPASSVQEGHSSNVAGQLSHTLVLDVARPSRIEKILVYKEMPPQLTRQDIIALGLKFNMSATDRIKEGNEGFSIASEDKSIYAYLFNTGTIEYHNTNRANNVNSFDVPGNLPSDDEAVKIATIFLTERDLLPDGAIFKKTTHGKIYQRVRDGDNIVSWEDVQVWYGRMLNNMEVKGTKISVDVGGGGDIIDFYSNWRNYKPYQEMPLKSPERAFEELKTKGVPVEMATPDNVSINEIYLAYHSKPGSQMEYYLEPVWVLKGNVLVNGKSVESVEEYIPALTVESLKSLSSS